MNILETLIQLRDDIKIWVTNNLVALDAKIESKTIPIDNKLNTESTNPVQNKIIKAKTDELANAISALDNVIETIQNNIDNITDDGSGEFNIADPNGNIIFKVNKDGIHTTNINTNGDNFTISDANGNIIFKVDVNGVHTTKLKLSSGDIDTQLDAIEDEIARVANEAFSGDYNDLTNKPSLEDDGSGEYIIVDEAGNIIFKVDANGAHTTEIDLGGTKVKETLETLSENIDNINEVAIPGVADALATHKADTNNPHEVAFKQLKDNNIEDDESAKLNIVDDDGNVIAKVDENGIHSTSLTLKNPLNIENGGTNNTTGRVQIGQKEGETLGTNATSEGYNTIASGSYSHAEGKETKASGRASHAEGGQFSSVSIGGVIVLPDGTQVSMSHITEASGDSSHAEGYPTRAEGECSHSEGSMTLAQGAYSHAEGNNSISQGTASHAEGSGIAQGDYAHAEGNSVAQGDYAHSEGHNTRALNSYSHAEGMATVANGISAHAEGSCHVDFITALQQYNTENQTSITFDSDDDDLILAWNSSVIQRESSLAQGIGSHVEGFGGLALGEYSHAEGQSNLAKGHSSHAEGIYTEARGEYSHAEGVRTIASGQCSHAQGTDTMATGKNSIAAGETAIAQGDNSVAIGKNIFVSGQYACALGQGAAQTIYLSGEANATQYTLTELQTFDSYATLSSQRVNADGSISSSPPLSGTQYVQSASTTPPRGTSYGTQYNYYSVIYELTPGNKYLFSASSLQNEIYLFSSYDGSAFSGALTLPDNGIIDRTNALESIFLVAPLRILTWVYRYNGYTQTASDTYVHSYASAAVATRVSNIRVANFVETTAALQLPGYIKNNNIFVKVESQSGSSITLSDTLSTTEISNAEYTLINDSAPGSSSFAIGCNTIAEGHNQLVCGVYNITDSSSLFIVGNGTSSTSKSNAMSVSQTGEVTASKVYGAVWNDYAEYRTQKEIIEPGYCVASTDNGQVYKTTEKFQACDGIVSDTFGFAIGETNECQTPLAVAGRVLAYCEGNRYDYHAGDTVCAGPEGKVCKMTREEIREWPDRIIGIVSEIPEYETWGTGNIAVNGRIWIKVK